MPTRKIRYWEDKGIIASLTEKEGKNRSYNYENIKKGCLSKNFQTKVPIYGRQLKTKKTHATD